MGHAELDVVKAKGPGNDVAVLSWSVGGGAGGAGPGSSSTTTAPPTSTTTTTTPTTTSTTPAGVSWTSHVTSEWQSGYCVEVTVTNTQKNTEKWTVQVPVKGAVHVLVEPLHTVGRHADRQR